VDLATADPEPAKVRHGGQSRQARAGEIIALQRRVNERNVLQVWELVELREARVGELCRIGEQGLQGRHSREQAERMVVQLVAGNVQRLEMLETAEGREVVVRH